MGSQKGTFGSLLMLAGTVMAIVVPPFGAAWMVTVWAMAAMGSVYAGSLLMQAALEDKLAKDQMGIQSTTRGTQEAMPIVYGTDVRMGSVLADMFAAGTGGEDLHSVNVLSVTPDNGEGIGGITRVTLASEGDVALALDPINGTYSVGGNGGEAGGVAQKYQGFYTYNFHVGDTADNAVDPMMAAASSGAWPTTSKGYGLAYAANKFTYDYNNDADQSIWSAMPDLRFIVDGIKVADFRENPVTYDASNNPALNLYDYLISDRYGLGMETSELDVDSFTVAANYCDTGGTDFEQIKGSGTGLNTTAGFTYAWGDNFANTALTALILSAKAGDSLRILNGANTGTYAVTGPSLATSIGLFISIAPATFASSQTNMEWELIDGRAYDQFLASGALMTDAGHKSNIEALLAGMRGNLFWMEGKFHLWIRAPETAETFELNSDTNIDSIEIVRPGVADTPNIVEVNFINPDKNWTVDTVIYPHPAETGGNPYLDEDNGIESRIKIDLPLTSHIAIARSIAEVMLKEGRNNTMVKLTTTEAALVLSIGDVVKLTDDSAGWTAKEFWVMSMGITEDNKVSMSLMEYDINVYTTNGQLLPGEVPGTDVPSPLYIPAPTSLVLLSDATTLLALDSGARDIQQIKVTWTQSAAANLEYEEVFYKKTADTNWILYSRVYPFQATSNAQEVFISPVEISTAYDVRLISTNSLGVKSASVEDSVTTGTVADITGAGDNILLYEETTETATVGTLWLNITETNDADLSVDFYTRQGTGNWVGPDTRNLTAPYPDTISDTVAKIEGKQAYIRYEIKNSGGTVLYGATVSFDSDDKPAFLAIHPSFGAGGNVTVEYTVDDDTKSIEIAGAEGSPPSDATVKAATPIDTDVNRTGTTGTLVTIGEGETAYVGAFAYSLTGGDGGGGTTSERFNVVIYNPGAPHVPLVSAQFDLNQLTLIIVDPENRVSSVAFRNYENGVMGDWSIDTVGPDWDVVRSVTLHEKHTSIIMWEVGYDTDTKWIKGSAAWDIDGTPSLEGGDLTVDGSGDVWLTWQGDDDVKYIRYKTDLSDYPTWGVDPDIEGTRDPVDPPADEERSGVVKVYSGLAEGSTCYVSYHGFVSDGNTWTTVAHRRRVTRPTSGVDTIFPAVQVTAGLDDITLTIDDPNGVVNGIGFRTYVTSGTPPTLGWGSWTDDLSDPYLDTWSVTREEKHIVKIGWRVRYDLGTGDGNKYLERSVSFDPDNNPGLSSIDLTVNDSGNVYLAYSGDDDTLSVKYLLDAAGYKSRQNVIDGSNVLDGTSRTDVLLESAIAEGATRWLTMVPYSGANATGNPGYAGYSKRVTRPTDTNIDTVIPTVQATAGASNITLVINDPDNYTTGVSFRTYTGGAWGNWTDDFSDPYLKVWSVTREEKHNVAIGYKVRYDVGDGNVFIENSVTFDPDDIPELLNVDLSVDGSGNVYLAYTGDDDTQAVKWYDGTSYPTWATVTGSGTPSNATSASNVLVQSGIAEGATRYIGVVPYPESPAGGTPSDKLWLARVTRPTDTIGGDAEVAVYAKRTVDLDGSVNMRWYASSGVESISYISNVDGGFGSWATNPNDTAWTTPDGTQDKSSTYIGNFLSAIETLAYGETAYIALLAWSGAAPSGGTRSGSIFTTEIQRNPVHKGDAPEQVMYQISTPGESGFVTNDIWYDTASTPWVKNVFDSTKGVGQKWQTIASTFPRGIARNSVGGIKSQAVSIWPEIVFKDNMTLTPVVQGLSWGVDEGSSELRVSAAVITLIDSASDIDPGAIAARSTGQYMKWNGSAHEWGTPPTGASNLDELTDVLLTAPATGDYLRFDGAVEVDQWKDVGISQVLTDLKTVDGSGSGLNADLLDGQHGTYYAISTHNHDHGFLTGLTGDDHTMYSRTSGLRAFTAVVSGVTPTADAHLATKGYVDGAAVPSHNLASHSDVSAGASGDLLYNSAGTWVGQTPAELSLVTDTDISVQQDDTHKGYLGPNDINFEAGSGATVVVADIGTKINVTYSVDTSSIGSSYGENTADYQIGIDSNGGGTNYFRIRKGTYSGGTQIMTIAETGSMLLQGTIGDLTINGDLVGGNLVTGTKWTCYNSGYATFGASNSGDDVQLEVAATTDRFHLYDGTSRDWITPLYGFATGTGGPGAVTGNYGAIYLRHEA